MANANNHGGRRQGAGRPVGSRPLLRSKDYGRVKEVVERYDSTEFLITNAAKVFKGNSREFLVSVYQAEQLPVRVRVYAACKAVELEPAPAISSGTSGESAEEALVRAILKLKDTEDAPKGPAEIMPPPKPRARARPSGPVTDMKAEASAEHPQKSSDYDGAPQSTHPPSHASGADDQHSGANSAPETAHEITAQESAQLAAIQHLPHLMPRRN